VSLGEVLTLSTGCTRRRINRRRGKKMKWHEELHHRLDEVTVRLDEIMVAVQREPGSSSVEPGNDLSVPVEARG
jgi:hypothetical protein